MLGERRSFGGAVTAVTSGAAAFLPGVLLADAQKAVVEVLVSLDLGLRKDPERRPPYRSLPL
jgi:hypothetical protein